MEVRAYVKLMFNFLTGRADYACYSSMLLYFALHVPAMQALQEQTGVTWNKRFKKQFGPINKVSLA